MSLIIRNLFFASVALGVSLIAGLSSASAEENTVRVFDCNGAVRFEQMLPTDVFESTLEMQVAGLQNGEEITLVQYPAGTPEKLVQIENGIATFKNVRIGEWQVCPSKGEVEKVSMIVSQNDSDDSLQAVALTGLVGAATLGGIALGSNGGGDNGTDIGTFTDNNTVTDTAASSGSPSSRSRPRARASEDCFIDEEVEPLSPAS